MPPPTAEPIGLQLARIAKALSASFDDALAAAGATLPTWLVLVSIKAKTHGTQRELAEAVGVEGPTLTHHLNRMEADGLVTRRRDPENRRVHQVELTPAGEALFLELVQHATAFDHQLRAGFSAKEISSLRSMLDRLLANVSDEAEPPR